MPTGLIVLVAGLIAVAVAYLLTVSENRKAGGDLSQGQLIRGSEGGVSALTSLLMLSGQAAILVGVVLLAIELLA